MSFVKVFPFFLEDREKHRIELCNKLTSRSVLKGEAGRFVGKSVRPPSCASPLENPHYMDSNSQQRTELCQRPFVLLHTAVRKGLMNKGICSQFRGELFRIIICHLSIGLLEILQKMPLYRAVAASTPCFSFPYMAL
jgi:hypothetical protein